MTTSPAPSVEPAPSWDPSTLERVERCRRGLSRVEPRNQQLLLAVVADQVTLSHAAAHYGVSPESFAVLFWRAAQELERTAPANLPPQEEQRRARALYAALSTPASPDDDALIRALRELRELGPLVRRRLRELEKLTVESPSYRRDLWIRRVLIAIVVGAALYFYSRPKQPPPRERRPASPLLKQSGPNIR